MTLWHRLSRGLLLAGGGLFAALGARFLWVAWVRWEPPQTANLQSPQPAQNPLSDVQRALPVIDLGGAAVNGGLSEGQQTRSPSDTPVLLFVSTEGPRQDVLVNGAVLGQSPYMGQIYCERGSSVRVTLRAPGGQERLFTRPCTPEIRVSD
jgi:hypothetical protein